MVIDCPQRIHLLRCGDNGSRGVLDAQRLARRLRHIQA